jgi:hypothetical protein
MEPYLLPKVQGMSVLIFLPLTGMVMINWFMAILKLFVAIAIPHPQTARVRDFRNSFAGDV